MKPHSAQNNSDTIASFSRKMLKSRFMKIFRNIIRNLLQFEYLINEGTEEARLFHPIHKGLVVLTRDGLVLQNFCGRPGGVGGGASRRPPTNSAPRHRSKKRKRVLELVKNRSQTS